MQLNRRQHLAIVLILFCSLLSVLRLGHGGLSAPEEAAISSRFADYLPIPKFLYQAITSDAERTIRQIRIISAVFSGIALMLTYQIAARVLSLSLSLAAPAILAGILGWNSIARSATPDAMIAASVLAAVLLLLKLPKQSTAIKSFVREISFFGAFALLSFIYPAAYLIGIVSAVFLWQSEKGASGIRAGIAVMSGSLIVIPWVLHHSSSPSLSRTFPDVVEFVLHYPLVLPLPFALWYIIRLRHTNSPSSRSQYSLLLVLLAVVLLIVSLQFGTSYKAVWLPFAVLASLRMLELLFVPQISPRFSWIVVVVLYCSMVFPLFQFTLASGGISLAVTLWTIGITGGVTVAAGLALPLKTVRHWLAYTVLRAGVIIPLFLLLRVAAANLTTVGASSLPLTGKQYSVIATP